jgi:hypothetical protein
VSAPLPRERSKAPYSHAQIAAYLALADAQPTPARGMRAGGLICRSPGTMIAEEHGSAVPELARRMTLTSCHLDPARAMVPVLQRMIANGIPLGDVLADSGYAHRPREPGRAAARRRSRAHPGSPSPRPRPEGNLRWRGHLQREPVLPRHAPAAARTRPPGENIKMKEPIHKITVKNRSVRYRVVVDIGRDENGRRKQFTLTFDT